MPIPRTRFLWIIHASANCRRLAFNSNQCTLKIMPFPLSQTFHERVQKKVTSYFIFGARFIALRFWTIKTARPLVSGLSFPWPVRMACYATLLRFNNTYRAGSPEVRLRFCMFSWRIRADCRHSVRNVGRTVRQIHSKQYFSILQVMLSNLRHFNSYPTCLNTAPFHLTLIFFHGSPPF